jgi:hypothetical protein
LLRALALPVPGQQIGDPLGGMVGQARKHVGEPGLRIDIGELGGGDQRVDGGGTLRAAWCCLV